MFNISDGSKFGIVYEPKINLIIGTSIIGDATIDETDLYESFKIKEDFNIEII